jgi:endonuclease YncB( thermonuclease family)
MRMAGTIIIGLLVLGVKTAMAEALDGYVVSISDGDTLTMQVDRQQHRIRIAGIDAPEHFQPYGNRSRTNLSRYAYSQDARAECYKKDIYGRDVCKVWVKPFDCSSCGKSLDVGLAQVSEGMAWWDRNHANEQSAEDREHYESAETIAKLRRFGLWRDTRPVPPWAWRHSFPPGGD